MSDKCSSLAIVVRIAPKVGIRGVADVNRGKVVSTYSVFEDCDSISIVSGWLLNVGPRDQFMHRVWLFQDYSTS